MNDPEPHADRSESRDDSSLTESGVVRTREVITVRRRRSRLHPPNWIARQSARRSLQMVAACGGLLVLMAVGLYFGLGH